MLEHTNPKFLAKKQYSNPTNLYLRRALFDYAVPTVSVKDIVFEHLKLRGNESILEVGCGNGNLLVDLRRKGHSGNLVGLDIAKGMFAKSQKAEPSVRFVVGSADKCDFPDKTFDVILAFYMIYHLPSIKKALLEWSRLLKDDGRVVIVTNGSQNRIRLHNFKKRLARKLKSKYPPNFSSRFNLENGKKQIRRVFTITDSFVYKGKVIINEPLPYTDAMESYRSLFDPKPTSSQWKKALGTIRKGLVDEIRKNGCFVDNAATGFFICSKRTVPEL